MKEKHVKNILKRFYDQLRLYFFAEEKLLRIFTNFIIHANELVELASYLHLITVSCWF